MKVKGFIYGFISVVFALGYSEGSAEGLTGEVQFVSAASRNIEEVRSLSQISVYLEADIADELSGFLIGYYDREFRSTLIGLAKKYGNLQIALGFGQATYDQINHLVLNPWLYYSNDDYRGYLHAEYYSKERDEPWFFKGYILKKLGDLSVGAYGESDFGIGPRLDIKMAEHWNIFAAIPIACRPKEGSTKAIIGVTVDF